MSQMLKERKFVQCFRSNKNGSCNHCKKRSWLVGYKIYGMKDEKGRWLVCSDKKCYLEQGGILTVYDGTPLYPEEELKAKQCPNNDDLVNKLLELQTLTNDILTIVLARAKAP